MPDSVFIEDTAVVLPEIAVIARPGAESRRIEVSAVDAALEPLRRLFHIGSPGTLDGGDVLVIGRTILVGRSTRTNDAGVEQLRAAVAPFGYAVDTVSTSGCLHLKSAVTAIDERTVLINPSGSHESPSRRAGRSTSTLPSRAPPTSSARAVRSLPPHRLYAPASASRSTASG
jgi:dimethylargininase